jgi:hypothetical protein
MREEGSKQLQGISTLVGSQIPSSEKKFEKRSNSGRKN